MSLVILRLLFESLQFFLVNGVLKEYALFNFIKGVLNIHDELVVVDIALVDSVEYFPLLVCFVIIFLNVFELHELNVS